MKTLETFDLKVWDKSFSKETQNQAVRALEEGKILYFPELKFSLSEEEKHFLSPATLDPKSKNVSYDIAHDRLGGSQCLGEEADELKAMLKRYAIASRNLLHLLIPSYDANLIQGKTSFRPVEIEGRKTSYRKDDTLLHVDAFPSNPTKGQRILRVFTNINQDGKPRVWRAGESFEDVVKKFALKVPGQFPGIAQLLKLFKITKDLRTPYDHYMLHIHDNMKGNSHYQKNVSQEELHFPPGSTWIVYTDQVSHAAMKGQHVLEQTFHMPVSGLQNQKTSPLRVLERYLNKTLV